MNRLKLLLTTLVLVASCGLLQGDDISYLPPPFVGDEAPAPPPDRYFSIDFAFVQPRLRGFGGDAQDVLGFSPRLDWTVSPRIEFGFTTREPWNPYIGYRGVYSDNSETAFDPASNAAFLFSRTTELHAIDFGIRSSPFCLLNVLPTEWDLAVRVTGTDFRDYFDFEFGGGAFVNAKLRQEFLGAGPRAGLRTELPFGGTGFSFGGQWDAGIQWGGYRAQLEVVTSDGETLEQERAERKKGGVLWHVGGQVAFRYAWPLHDPRIVYSAGYLYEAWFSKDLGLLDGGERGRFDYHGPFVRFEWRF